MKSILFGNYGWGERGGRWCALCPNTASHSQDSRGGSGRQQDDAMKSIFDHISTIEFLSDFTLLSRVNAECDVMQTGLALSTESALDCNILQASLGRLAELS